MVFITPEEAEKLVELNAAIPLVVPSAAALSMVRELPDVRELLMVKAPVIAEDPPVEPVRDKTPVLVIVTAPVAPDTLIPVPATLLVTPVFERVRVPPRDTGEPLTHSPVPPVTVMELLASSALVTTLVDNLPVVSVWTTPAPNPKRLIFPVDEEPNVNDCLFVVANIPFPESVVALAPLFADIDAVGVPPETLMKANLEEEVAVEPRRRSRVGFPV